MKKKKIILGLICLVSVSALTACAAEKTQSATSVSLPQSGSSEALHTITVNSSEELTVIPDIAEIVYAVSTQEKSADTCYAKNADAVNQVTALLKDLGIAEASIQTSNYTMQPIYSYANNTQKITGYQANTTLTVSDLPISGLGDILTKSVGGGINTVQSIRYSSSKYDEAYQEALKLAVSSAKAKAQTLADAGETSLGKVISIAENSRYSEVRYTDRALTNQLAAKEELMDTSIDIMPGEVSVKADITVSYQIQ